MSPREQREEAFREAQAILALENMAEPAGFAELRQEVIDGKLSIPEAIAKVTAQIEAQRRKVPPAK